MIDMTGLSVLPAAGVPRRFTERDDPPIDRWQRKMFARQQVQLELRNLLGIVFRDATTLMRPGQSTLRAYDRFGHTLRWSLWAPHKSLLIDVYRQTMPAAMELEDRDRFAQQHHLRYGLVEPGKRLTLEALRAWLAGEED